MQRFLGVLFLVTACASKPSSLEQSSAKLGANEAGDPSPAEPQPSSSASDPNRGASDRPVEPAAGDDPRISRSAGEPGGVVVLWPRVNPPDLAEASRPIAQEVQRHMRALVERTLPGRAIDVRPFPERTCPRAGCATVAFGVLLLRRDEGCALVAFVMPPGVDDPTALVHWTGDLRLKQTTIPFRDFPESAVSVRDYAACSDLPRSLAEREADVGAALRRAAP